MLAQAVPRNQENQELNLSFPHEWQGPHHLLPVRCMLMGNWPGSSPHSLLTSMPNVYPVGLKFEYASKQHSFYLNGPCQHRVWEQYVTAVCKILLKICFEQNVLIARIKNNFKWYVSLSQDPLQTKSDTSQSIFPSES